MSFSHSVAVFNNALYRNFLVWIYLMFSFSWDVKAYNVNQVYDYVYTIYKEAWVYAGLIGLRAFGYRGAFQNASVVELVEAPL
jgi:hypothetical protein